MKTNNMKTNNEIVPLNTLQSRFGKACLASCQKLVKQMKQTKETILNEFKGMFDAQEHLLRLALNEAEAQAWQTGFPHLVFADLATEKAEEAARTARQRARH